MGFSEGWATFPTPLGAARSYTVTSCSVFLSPGLTTILLCKAPPDDPELGGWSELLIKEGQADGPDCACQEQRKKEILNHDFKRFLYFTMLGLGILLVWERLD